MAPNTIKSAKATGAALERIEEELRCRKPPRRIQLLGDIAGSSWTPYVSPKEHKSPSLGDLKTEHGSPGSFPALERTRARSPMPGQATACSTQRCERITVLQLIQQQKSMVYDLSQKPFWPFVEPAGEENEKGKEEEEEEEIEEDGEDGAPLTRQGNIFRDPCQRVKHENGMDAEDVVEGLTRRPVPVQIREEAVVDEDEDEDDNDFPRFDAFTRFEVI
ncbi:MAG: hypothetical protein Q9160_007348 [Pyrenula sp. 1 TL-2023]